MQSTASSKHNNLSTVSIGVHGMRVASAFFLAGIVAIIAPSPHASFRYELLTSFRRSDDSCRICYADDCITMDEARCVYYVEVDEIMEKPVEDGEVTDIDEMMYDLTEQATMSWAVEGCIPFISQRSDCNKENFCVGCQTCECTSTGKWACTEVQRCRADVEQDVDHRTLVMVMEKLMEDGKSRRKRSMQNKTDLSYAMTSQEKKMSLVDIAQWMYGVTPNPDRDDTDNYTKVLGNHTENSTQSTNSSQPADLEYLDFEEVLNNIVNEDQTYKTKLKLKDTHDANGYMLLKDYKIKKRLENYNAGNHFMNFLSAIEEGNDVTEPINTERVTLVVDLLPHVNNNHYYDHNNATDNEYDVNNIIYKEENNTINNIKDSFELDSINVMKRDVLSVTDLENMTQAINATATPFETKTDKNNILKNSVLMPLTNIIDNKANEVKNLLQIKENLINYISMLNDTVVNVTCDFGAADSGINTHISTYELDIFPETQEDLRRSSPRVLDKLLYKLKRDIYEVFRDISSIQKLSKTRDIPYDLKKIIRSMKYFLHEQGSFNDLKRKHSRRVLMKSASADTHSSIKSQLIDILEALDRNTPRSNALTSLSRSLRKIIKRIIKQNYVDEFSIVGLKVFDTNYNLSADLRTIGKSWPQLTANVANSSPHEKLYAMKLLHFALSEDIGRIKDAIALVDFAYSRRMSPNIETQSAEKIMGRISSGLSSIKNKVEVLIKHHAARTKTTKDDGADKKVKKQSFLNRIRNMLRSSKKDILDMAKKKIPKSDIFKIIAKKKLKELTVEKDKNTMLRWQNNLDIAKRINKRDVESRLNSMKNRIKNIIPKYLRGKLDPALAKKWKSKQQLATKKKTKSIKQVILATPAIKTTISPMMKIHKRNNTIKANHHK